MSTLRHLHASSLREQAAAAIRASIVTGEIASGELYSAPSLAQRLGVSATPVREALLDLANQGLVEAVRNRGFRIREITDQDLDEIFELRRLIEVPSMGRLADELTPKALHPFRALARAMEDHVRAGRLGAFLTDDRKFHQGLLSLLNNQRLLELDGRLRDQTRLYGLPHLLESGQLTPYAQEHHQLLDALSVGDRRRTEHLTRNHLSHIRGIWAGTTAVR